MAWYDKYITRIAEKILFERQRLEDKTEKTRIIETPMGRFPISAGRSSEPESGFGFGLYGGGIIEPEFQIELLRAIENLAKFNPDVSFAVDNIVQLGNTKFDIYFSDNIKDELAIEMLQEIKQAEKIWYTNTGGMMSLRGDLFTQVVLTGAISAERIPTNNLDGIRKIVLVNPRTVRFAYNEDEDDYSPYQVSSRIAVKKGVNAVSGMNPLNPLTYKYLAFRKFNEGPYAIPPFLSALENLDIEKYMISNFKTIVQKLGVMGFLNVLVKCPVKLAEDSDDEYARKVNDFLLQATKEVDKGVRKGYVVGFKDQHEFNMKSIAGNVSGVETLFKLNDNLKMAGLKQDPLMLGRNYSTTETLGRVILAKMGSQIENYQNIIDMFLADTILLHLLLKDYPVQYVQVESRKSLVGDEAREQDVYRKKIDNAEKLYNMGIISQHEVANIAGYDKADQEEPRTQITINIPSDDGSTEPDAVDPKTTDYKAKISSLELQLGKSKHEFNYDIGNAKCKCGCCEEEFSAKSKAAQEFDKIVREYAKSLGITYDEAIGKITNKVANGLMQFNEGVPLEMVVDNAIYNTFLGFQKHFSIPVQKVVKGWIGGIYKYYREKTSIFGADFKPPKPIYNLKDFRTIEYYKKSDSFYLGKFITDADSKRSITEFIKKAYLEEGTPIGRDPLAIVEFKKKFADVLKGEDWKISRIVNTTVNRMRNTAAINYMNQAEVLEFEIVGIPDKLQCAYCASMQGKVFSVERSLQQIEALEETPPESVAAVSPFLTSVFYEDAQDWEVVEREGRPNYFKELKEMDDSLIQDEMGGGGYPPFHCNCRCQAIAKL